MKTAPTVAHARFLLTRAARRPTCAKINDLPTPRAIQIIREALRGRPAASPISAWLAEVISLIACRHDLACGHTPKVQCRACGCFLCLRRAAR